MRQVNISGLLLLLFCHAIPFWANLNSEVPAALPKSTLITLNTALPVQGNITGFLPFSDPLFESYPLQREYDDGRSPFRFLSQAFIKSYRFLMATAPVLMPKRRVLIFPTLYTRAIIYPFHSFL